MSANFKTESVVKMLLRRFGGKWRYDRREAIWFDDENKRHVYWVHTGGCDMNGEAMPGSSLCMYYEDGRIPEWVY